MENLDALINEFCWDYLEWVRKGCSPFNRSFEIGEGLCLNAISWYREKFDSYGSGPMREHMQQTFLNEFGNKSYPFNKGGAEFHDEIYRPANHKRIAWARQRALMHKPLPFDPLDDTELHHADPGCTHVIQPGESGGIRCIKCGGWFCF